MQLPAPTPGAGEKNMIEVLNLKALGVVAVTSLSACAAINGTRPQDMTVPEHEEAANVEARRSEEAAKAAAAGGRSAEYERYSERRHRRLAREHAAAAEARRREVAATCADADRSVSLTSLKITRVEPIRENDVPKELRNPRGFYQERLKGARIALAIDAEMTPAAAAHSVQCDAAREAAQVDAANPASPFAVPTAQAVVRAETPGVVVEVRGDAGEPAKEILRRADDLAQAGPQVGR
jgi:hypothetical protein